MSERMTPLMTQAQFARYRGVNRSTVSRLKRAGRLVMDGKLVVVEASMKRLEATQSEHHHGVTERWDAQRAARAAAPPPEQQADEPPIDIDDIGRRTRLAQMRKAEAEANARERENEIARGVLVERAAVRRDIHAATSVILSAWEALPDRLAPLLVNVDDPQRVRAILRDEIEQVQQQISAGLEALA